MSMTGLTPEQRRLIEQAGGVCAHRAPETHQAYVLIRADRCERVRFSPH
jgi:hypothetical protein